MKHNEDPFKWLIGQLEQTRDWQRVINEANQKGTILRDVIHEAQVIYQAQNGITENTSDGYHTFKTLYAIRKAYNVALFNEWGRIIETLDPYGRRFGEYEELVEHSDVADKYFSNALSSKIGSMPKYYVHKSRRHHDGEYPFGKDNWFIVCAMLPTGQISNHYPIEDWDLFEIPESEKALFPFDGHTTEDVIDRLLNKDRSPMREYTSRLFEKWKGLSPDILLNKDRSPMREYTSPLLEELHAEEVLEESKGLPYWKNNAEDNYMTTPISVLRYISELEKLVYPNKNTTDGEKMTEKEAIITLAYYNDWRKGDEAISMPKPKKINQAIEVVIQEWKKRN